MREEILQLVVELERVLARVNFPLEAELRRVVVQLKRVLDLLDERLGATTLPAGVDRNFWVTSLTDWRVLRATTPKEIQAIRKNLKTFVTSEVDFGKHPGYVLYCFWICWYITIQTILTVAALNVHKARFGSEEPITNLTLAMLDIEGNMRTRFVQSLNVEVVGVSDIEDWSVDQGSLVIMRQLLGDMRLTFAQVEE